MSTAVRLWSDYWYFLFTENWQYRGVCQVPVSISRSSCFIQHPCFSYSLNLNYSNDYISCRWLFLLLICGKLTVLSAGRKTAIKPLFHRADSLWASAYRSATNQVLFIQHSIWKLSNGRNNIPWVIYYSPFVSLCLVYFRCCLLIIVWLCLVWFQYYLISLYVNVAEGLSITPAVLELWFLLYLFLSCMVLFCYFKMFLCQPTTINYFIHLNMGRNMTESLLINRLLVLFSVLVYQNDAKL